MVFYGYEVNSFEGYETESYSFIIFLFVISTTLFLLALLNIFVDKPLGVVYYLKTPPSYIYLDLSASNCFLKGFSFYGYPFETLDYY